VCFLLDYSSQDLLFVPTILWNSLRGLQIPSTFALCSLCYFEATLKTEDCHLPTQHLPCHFLSFWVLALWYPLRSLETVCFAFLFRFPALLTLDLWDHFLQSSRSATTITWFCSPSTLTLLFTPPCVSQPFCNKRIATPVIVAAVSTTVVLHSLKLLSGQ